MKGNQQTSIFAGKTPSLGSIKQQIDQLSGNPGAKLGLRFGFLSLGLSLLVLALKWTHLPPELPLLYSRPYGEQQLIPLWQAWLLPLIGLVIELIAVRGAGAVMDEDKLLGQILIWSAAVIALMILIALVKTVWLVT